MFQELTSRFSQPSVPLVNETYPELLSLRARLQDVRDDFFKVGLSPVTRVAAQASLLVFDKYMGLDQDSDVYDIAVGTYLVVTSLRLQLTFIDSYAAGL